MAGIVFLGFSLLCESGRAWNDHEKITKLCFQDQQDWMPAFFEPIEEVLPALSIHGGEAPRTAKDLASQLKIHGDKIQWSWIPASAKASQPSLLDVLAFSSGE
ncbi:MAG: hypothetical protein AB1540_13020, partial [Bdellovibrionota bacterium]